jgi:hypothetical protein
MNAPTGADRSIPVWRTPPALVPLAIVVLIVVYAVIKHGA